MGTFNEHHNFEEIYGASLSKSTISKITDRVLTETADWAARPLEKVLAAVFIDAIYVKDRDGQVASRHFDAAIGVDLAGHEDVLGLCAGAGGEESAKFWLQVLTELRNRRVEDVFFVVCDGRRDFPNWVGVESMGGVGFTARSGSSRSTLVRDRDGTPCGVWL